MLVFLVHWFTKRERSRANTFLILGNPVTVLWMSAISGFLIAALGWQWMFILEGIPSIIWAFIWLKITVDRPVGAVWLPRDQALQVEETLRREQQDIAHVRNYWAAFRTGNVILLAAQYFFWSIGVYGFVIWLPSIIKGSSRLGIGATGLLTAIPYLLAVILMVVASFFSDRTLERKLYVWPFLLAGAIAFYVSFLAGPGNFVLAFIFLVIAGGCMYAPYGPFFAILPEILPANVAGESMAFVNSLGALGSFVGAFFVGWLDGVSGGNGAGFLFMAAALVIAAVLTAVVRMPRTAPHAGASAETLDQGAAATI